jgi:hypothetical protein
MALTSAEIQQVLDAIAALGLKITGLSNADTLTGDELIELSQDGNSVKTTISNLLALVNLPKTDTTFVPTITAQVNGVFTITNFKIKRVGDIGTFSFAGRFDLEGGETSGNAKFDLPTLFQPSANWASQTDVNVIMSGTNRIFTANCFIAADDSGTKLLQVSINNDEAGASIRFSAIGEYVIS